MGVGEQSTLDERGENNYFTEMCADSEEGSHLRLIDFVYHSTLGLRVTKKKKEVSALDRALSSHPAPGEWQKRSHPGGNPGANRWFL